MLGIKNPRFKNAYDFEPELIKKMEKRNAPAQGFQGKKSHYSGTPAEPQDDEDEESKTSGSITTSKLGEHMADSKKRPNAAPLHTSGTVRGYLDASHGKRKKKKKSGLATPEGEGRVHPAILAAQAKLIPTESHS
jgi:hypothetical protein